MSKVICDVCGTSYPETSTQCPICGCVRPADAPSIPEEGAAAAATGTYQHVKGGRFSKANVRKRNAGVAAAAHSSSRPGSKQSDKKNAKKGSSNKGLVVTIIVLLLAILAVIGYIFVKFFLPAPQTDDGAGESISETKEPTDPPTDPVFPCESISLDISECTINEIGAQYELVATVAPTDTTDTMEWSCEDESVATVADGVVTAVSFGETVVTVKCGEFTAECVIIIEEPFELDRDQVILSEVGQAQSIYSGTLDLDKINWTTDNESVAVVSDGVITAVGAGNTMIHGEYKGTKLSCVVVCNIEEPTEPEEETSGFAPGPYEINNLYGLYDTEATVAVGDSFTLELLDANGDTVSGVTWTVSDASCCTVSDGVVKALASGTATVTASYNGQEFDFTVYVV